jgi:2'-5' RNA ligase
VTIGGIGVFPSQNYIRIIWAGINKGRDELDIIFQQIEPELRMLGFKPERKGFSPHITIARVRSRRQKDALLRVLNELGNQEFGTLRASCLRLKKSTLTPSGPIYSTLREVCR